MSKIKAKRTSVSLDMTAMCDVAFLLLTFFILTAKAKPAEVVAITPPSSISTTQMDSKEPYMTVTVSEKGDIYLSTEDNDAKKTMLERMANRFGLSVTAEMQKKLYEIANHRLPRRCYASSFRNVIFRCQKCRFV